MNSKNSSNNRDNQQGAEKRLVCGQQHGEAFEAMMIKRNEKNN